MSSDKEEQVKPLAQNPALAVSPTVHPIGHGQDEEAARWWRSSQYLRKRRCFIWCCGCCGAFIVILGVVILVLALTLFKVKDPRLTMNSIHIHSFNAEPRDITDPANTVSVNATLTADISIKNPNVASFSFDNSTTTFYYQGETVGVAYAPDGRIGSHSTARMNVTVDVLADQVAQTRLNISLAGTSVNLTSFTDITGRVNVWGIYKRDVEILVNCSMTVDLNIIDQDVKNKVCQANVR